MPLQKRGNGWRAHRKKGSKTFHGPTRATEAAAIEDAHELDAAAAVSMERLQVKYMIGLLACCLVLLLHVTLAHLHRAPRMPVQKMCNGWRCAPQDGH